MSIVNYRDLIVWQKSMDLATMVYKSTASFPTEERFGLSQQMQRAAVSIASNIAEGHARRSTQDFRRFLNIAYGSRAELETQILLARRLAYLSESQRDDLIRVSEEIGRLINGLDKSLLEKLD